MLPWLALLFFQQPVYEIPNVEKNPHAAQADIDQGKKLYMGRCAGCHGPTGDGGKGANLAVARLPRAADDRSLYRIARYGIPDTEMPATLMAPREVWQVAAFVRTLGAVGREPVSGDARRGERVVREKGGCLGCHAIGMQGGHMGPALTDVGSRRSPGHLRAKLVDPASDIPDGFRVVEWKTPPGASASGVRLNEDTWSIQVLDSSGKMMSFWKKDLRDLKVEKRTPMPSYRSQLTAAEIDDAVAYLAGLRGAQ